MKSNWNNFYYYIFSLQNTISVLSSFVFTTSFVLGLPQTRAVNKLTFMLHSSAPDLTF